MGGCASRPKDLDINQPAPVQAAAVDKSDSIAQENNGGEETKAEEPSVDLSEAAQETKPTEQVVEVNPEEQTEAKTEEKVEANKTEDVVEVVVEVQQPVEVAPVEAVVAAEPEKILELVKEDAKPVEAQNSGNESNATLISVQQTMYVQFQSNEVYPIV